MPCCRSTSTPPSSAPSRSDPHLRCALQVTAGTFLSCKLVDPRCGLWCREPCRPHTSFYCFELQQLLFVSSLSWNSIVSGCPLPVRVNGYHRVAQIVGCFAFSPVLHNCNISSRAIATASDAAIACCRADERHVCRDVCLTMTLVWVGPAGGARIRAGRTHECHELRLRQCQGPQEEAHAAVQPQASGHDHQPDY